MSAFPLTQSTGNLYYLSAISLHSNSPTQKLYSPYHSHPSRSGESSTQLSNPYRTLPLTLKQNHCSLHSEETMFADMNMPLFRSYQSVPPGHTTLKAITSFQESIQNDRSVRTERAFFFFQLPYLIHLNCSISQEDLQLKYGKLLQTLPSENMLTFACHSLSLASAFLRRAESSKISLFKNLFWVL